MNKVTGNKLIARFMDWDTADVYWHHPTIKKIKSIYSLDYNKRWKLLMPVVDKIEHLGETDKSLGYIDINSHYCEIVSLIKNQPNIIVGCYSESPEKIKTATKIDAVWLAIVTFIQWYNLNNNS